MSQVTDYNIANASGASVRSDLNAVFDAIKTLNSGGSDPSNTEAFMPFVDTGDSNKLKIRNSSNNGFTTIGPVDTPNLGLLSTTGGTMTGVLQLPVGSATAPSVHFGQTNTGIFKGASHRVSVTSDGIQVFFADGTGININSSKELRWKDSDNSNYIGFKAVSNITNSFTLTLPSADGSSGQALLTNGSGTLSFGAPTVGAANLTGNTLASGVTASSLTSVGTLSSLAVSGTCTAATFSGSGASLTNIPAANLTGNLPALNGSALTNIPNISPIVFFGIQDTDQSIPSSSTAFTKLTNFSTSAVSLNTGSSWNATTGRFTVASGQAGTYKITGVGRLTGQRRQRTMRVGISKNGADPTFYMEEITRHNNSPSARFEVQTTVIQIMTLAVGDYVELMMYNGEDSAQDTGKEGTYFSGYRISE